MCLRLRGARKSALCGVLLALALVAVALAQGVEASPEFGRPMQEVLRGVKETMGYASARDGGTLPKVYNVSMRDGVKLYTEVWLPFDVPASEKVAVVLDRSPYTPDGTELLADLFLPHGFAAVGQNERATGDSQGSWTFWATAASDDQDTLAWLRAQPWCNGHVFQMGFSADGILTLLPAMLPQKIDAQWVGWTASQPFRVAFQNGAQRYQLTNHWLGHMHAYRPNTRPYIDTLLDKEAMSPWWALRTVDTPAQLETVTWPGVWWGASYDIFAQTELDAFFMYQTQSGQGARGAQKIIFSTRGHCITDKKAGHFVFPNDRWGDAASYQQAVNLFKSIDEGVEHYDAFAHLPGTSAADLKAYTIYVIGPQTADTDDDDDDDVVGMYWTTLDSWPVPSNKTLYFAPGGKLSQALPSAQDPAVASYVYDPADPVPSIGGNNLFMDCGPLDQAPIANRPDIVTWTSEPFTETTAFAGRMVAKLYVSSNATDTDFTVRTTDLYPDGQDRLLSDSVQRMRWRISDVTPSHMVPGSIYEITINMWWQAYVFAPGHALSVHISSSSFPRWSVNPNNGLLLNQTGPAYVAHNSVHYAAASTPSSITIPYVSLKDLPRNVVPI